MISRLAGDAVHVVTGPLPGCQDLCEPMATISETPYAAVINLSMNVGAALPDVVLVLAGCEMCDKDPFAHCAHNVGGAARVVTALGPRWLQNAEVPPIHMSWSRR